MSKIKTQCGHRYVKELGGAVRRRKVSFAAKWLGERGLINGRVLDYGCGYGFDAAYFEWQAYDPYYGPTSIEGTFDTILCNHVLNMLTRTSRNRVLAHIQSCLNDSGTAWLVVPRDLPVEGRMGLRKRIQNHVRLTLPIRFESKRVAIYQLHKSSDFDDCTSEFEYRLA